MVLSSFALMTQDVIFTPVIAQEKMQSGTAGAITTPQYAKKVAQTYCDFMVSGIAPSTAIRQAESEVANSAQKPTPFNETIYRKTLSKAINEKGFCPSAPKVEKIEKIEVVLERASCNLSQQDMLYLERNRQIKKTGTDCSVFIQVH